MPEGKEFPSMASEGVPSLSALSPLSLKPKVKSPGLAILGCKAPRPPVYIGRAVSEAEVGGASGQCVLGGLAGCGLS